MARPLAIVETVDAPKFRNKVADFWRFQGHEAILSGPYETGKTFGALSKLHALLCLFPRSRALMVRKTYSSLTGSAAVTYEQKVVPIPVGRPGCPIRKLGGSTPGEYIYPNESRIVLGGMDNADKFLSAEFDFVYVNQAEELNLDDWEKLVGRATGRAGNSPYPQVFGDCNPGAPTHWILSRQALKLFPTMHEDNPRLYDDVAGEWTSEGKRTMSILDSLTGLRYKRGRLGLWAAAEGQIYEYDPEIHLLDRFEIPDDWERFRVVDFGFGNPFVCQWWALDHDDRMYMYREIYMSQRLVSRHAKQILALSEGETIQTTVCDHDAEDRATLEDEGIPTIAAEKSVLVGIEKVQTRLAKSGDGRPRMFFLRDSLVEPDLERRSLHRTIQTTDEFGGYVWAPPESSRTGESRPDAPIKKDDHGMDCVRYATMFIDNPSSWWLA